MEMFRKLNVVEVTDFERWADDNYTPMTPIDGTWHPVIQARCTEINANYDFHTLELTESRKFIEDHFEFIHVTD